MTEGFPIPADENVDDDPYDRQGDEQKEPGKGRLGAAIIEDEEDRGANHVEGDDDCWNVE